MAPKHDAKRAAKKHAKEKKRKVNLAKRAAADRAPGASAVDARTDEQRFARARALAEHGARVLAERRASDPELDKLLDDVDVARLDPKRRTESITRMLDLDGLLAADGGIERFRRLDALQDMARLWMVLAIGTEDDDPIEPAVASMTRVLPHLPADDLEMQFALTLEALLFRLGRGDEALDRILVKDELDEDDLDNATSAVLDSPFSTRANILRVRDACLAWVPDEEGDGSLRDECVEALEAKLEALTE